MRTEECSIGYVLAQKTNLFLSRTRGIKSFLSSDKIERSLLPMTRLVLCVAHTPFSSRRECFQLSWRRRNARTGRQAIRQYRFTPLSTYRRRWSGRNPVATYHLLYSFIHHSLFIFTRSFFRIPFSLFFFTSVYLCFAFIFVVSISVTEVT